jgi:plasmid stability protein
MSNLTITVDEETLKKARIRAVTEGTSVNQVLRKYLEAYAGVSAEQRAALRDIIELSHQAKSRRSGKQWSRDELYDRK